MLNLIFKIIYLSMPHLMRFVFMGNNKKRPTRFHLSRPPKQQK